MSHRRVLLRTTLIASLLVLALPAGATLEEDFTKTNNEYVKAYREYLQFQKVAPGTLDKLRTEKKEKSIYRCEKKV